MARIILSYRRTDSAAIAGRIFDRLSSHYGEDAVFMDVDNIPFGIDFRDHIQTIMSAADLVIAVVGPRWTGAGAGSGGRDRIADSTDPVRVEIETALKRGLKIIPVLVDGAQMPDADALPEPIQQLAFINAAPVDTARDFRAHMDRLIRSIDRLALPQQPNAPTIAKSLPKPPGRRRRGNRVLIALLGAAAVAAGGAYVALQMGATPMPPPPGLTTEQPNVSSSQPPPSAAPTQATPPIPVGASPAPDTTVPSPGDDSMPEQRPHDYSVLPTISEGKLNMRSGPGTTYPLITGIPAGAQGLKIGVCTVPDDGGAKPWCETRWSKQHGWVSACCIVDEITGQPPQ